MVIGHFLLFLGFAATASAQPVVGFPSSSIIYAQPGRTHMDVGGTWSGAADVTATTGDTFSVTYTNSGTATAFDFRPYVTLPAGFLHVAGTAQVVTAPATPGLGVTANQVGQLLTFTLNPAGYDLPAGTSLTITYGLVTDFTVVSSTPQLVYNRDFSLTNGGALVGPGIAGQQNVLVKAGESIITINPKQQTRAVGETAVFTVTVTSTGLGGIFDVTIDESSINPGGNLQLLSITQITPATPVAVSTGGGSGLRLPYLASDQTFVAEVEAVVLGCGNTVNTVSSVHRANPVAITDTANLQLNILQPQITYNPADVVLNYNGPVMVAFDIQNTGAGVALGFDLQSNVNNPNRSVALTPAAITAGWTYNPANGRFSNGATLLPGAILPLSYTVEITSPDFANGAGTVTYTPSYTNGCGLALSLPQRSHALTLSAPGDPPGELFNAPTLTLTKAVSSDAIPYNSSGTYTLGLGATNLANITSTSVTVTDVLPAQVTYLAHTAPFGVVNVAGQTITWTVDISDLSSARELEIDFAVVDNPCIAGTTVTNTAATSAIVNTRGWTLSDSAGASFYVPTNPGPASSQSIGHTGSSPYETGFPDAAPLGVKGATEGDVIPLQATYTFANGYLGEWAGSTYTDNFGGVAQIALDPASVTVTGTFGTLAVPGGSITLNASGITIDLGFLAGPAYFNSPGVANRTFTINYKVTAPDSAIPSGSSRTVSHRVVLSLFAGLGGPTTCLVDSNNLFIQSTSYTIRRAAAQVGLSFPAVIDICDFDELLTITVSNANALQARNAFVTLLNVGTDYDYDTSFAPVYGGVFNSGNITYTANGGANPTFEFTGNPLAGTGTIQVRISRKPIPDTTPGSISARVDYDSWQTAPVAGRVYQGTTSYTPSSVRKATLNLTVSPVSIAVTSNRVGYGINVFNSDAGIGYGSVVTSTIPLGFTVNVTDTNAANPSYPVSVSAGPGGREVATWSVGDIASGGVRNLQLILDVGPVPGCSVVINPSIERIQATWGCDSEIFATANAAHPTFTFPNGRIQVLHDATQTVARLCSPGKILISVKNTGPTNVYGLEVEEIITDPTVIFIAGGANPVRYRLNNGPLQNLASPTLGTGGSGNPYRWTSAQIPALAELVPVGAPGTNLVTIEIDLSSTEDLAFTNPQMFASGEAALTCGTPVVSPAQPFTIPVEIAELSVARTGRNESAGDVAFTETTYGGGGDEITWRLVLTNNGAAPASNIRLSDQLSGSGGSAVINGPGLAVDTPYTPNLVLAVPDIAADGGTATYLITETLGGVCVNQSRSATVSWGCSAPGAGLHNSVNTPGDPVDGAALVMTPSVVGGTTFVQTITSLPGGLASVKVRMTNNGGTLYNPTITATIPAFAVHDTTGPVTFGAPSDDITGVSRTGGTDSAPVFTFSGPGAPHILRFGETVELNYIVRPAVFDPNQADTVANLFAAETTSPLDPVAPAPGNFVAFAQYTNSCLAPFDATDTTSLGLLRPDLDVTAVGPNSGNNILTATTTQNYTFTVTNVGPAGSVADRITLSLPDLGSGWTFNSATLTTPGTGGTGGTAALDGGVWTFTPAQVGTLTQNQAAVVTVNLTYNNASSTGPLTLRLRARGESRTHDGATITGDYSLDQRGQRILGVELVKTYVGTGSEPSSTGVNVLIGEDLTYRLTARFRGGEDDVSNIRLRDQLRRGARTGNDDGNLGFVRVGASPFVTTTGSHTAGALTLQEATNSGDVSAAVVSSRVTFTVPSLTPAAMASGATIEFELVARVMNLAAGGNNNNNDANRLNRAALQFDYLGTTFHPAAANSSTGTQMATGGVEVAGLYQQHQVTVRRPSVTIAKAVRNVTRSTAFGATTAGQAGDVVEYRITVTNSAAAGDRPLHGIRITDTVPAKINLSAADQGADTNGSNASIEVANSAGVSGLGATIVFDQSNTAIPTSGQNFDQLNPAQTLVLLYRGTLDSAVAPSETLVNNASVRAYSIPQDAPALTLATNQVAMKGTENTASGATRFTAAATANVVIDSIVQDKTLAATSEPGSAASAVFIGEQLRYRVTLNLPLGTVPDLSVTDTLPAGLALVGTPVVAIGADIAAVNEPPTFAQTNGGQTLTWSFGQAVSSGADRTITIDYVAQVRNIAGNVAGTALTNNAAYNFTGLPGDVVNLTQRTVTVAAPAVAVVHQVRNITRATAFAATAPADAGDILEYRVALSNPAAANRAPAYDLNFVDTLPAGLTYVPASTSTEVATGLTGTLVEPDVAGQVLTWGRTQTAPANLDLAIGSNNFEFRYRATVNDTSAPGQVYTNALVADWTSLDGAPGANLDDPILSPGDPLGERNGAGAAPNTYRSALSTTTTALNSTTVTKAKSGDTLPRTSADALDAAPSGFRVGDLVTYTVTIPVQEGTLANFLVRDTLPTGLAFHDTVSLAPATGTAPFTYTTPVAPGTAPALGATGALTWNLGTVVNAGDNDTGNNTLTLVYRARVLPAASPAGIAVTPADQTLNNTATARYTLADTSTHTTAASVAPVVARQPVLAIAKDVLAPAAETINGVSGLHLRRPGETASFRITVTNTGTAPAYNLRLTDTLPAGLRATAPVLTAATLNGAADLAGLSAAATWDTPTGAWVFDLADGQLLLPGQTLVLTYTVTVDTDNALKGATLTNSAAVNRFFSLPSAHPEAASRRQYAALAPVTRSLIIGLRIDGSVYHDTQPDNAKNVGEDWSGAAKPTVFANLVAANNTVVRTVTVAPGTGLFAFDYLPPGSYTIVVTDTAAKTTVQRPANWLFQFPATGSIAATLNSGTGDLLNQDLGLNQGAFATPLVAKAKSGDTLPTTAPLTGFRIGDLVTYTVTVNPQEGALTGFAVTDVLPAGLAFDSTVSITPATGGRYTYTTPAGANTPAAGATGTVTWNFGAFTNAISGPVTNATPAAIPAANQLVITYRARIRNNSTGTTPAVVPIAAPAVSPATTTTPNLVNSANVGYTKPAPDAGAKTAGPATATIQVEQPRLTIAKVRTAPTPGNLVVPGGTATFQVTVANDGTAPAYNTVVTDTLPVGLRGTAPSAFSATLNGSAVTLTPVWTAGTGTYVTTLSNTQLIQPGQSLVLTYTVTVDASATRGATLTNSAVVNQFFSKAATDTTQRRQYASVGPATASIVVGMAVSGFVYHDLQPDNALDVGEDWTGSGEPTVFVNLIQGGAVVRTATVAPGAGAFSFTNLPAGAYDLVVTDSATSVVATRPVNWPFQSPATGARAITLSNADLPAQNFGLHQGTLAAAIIAKSKAGDTLPLSAPAAGFRVGDLVTYTVDIQPQEGAFTDFTVTDVLPAGLAFVSTTSIAQVSGPSRFTYTTPAAPATAPSPGATGTVTWSFGNFSNALLGPADNTLRIVYTARVLDTGGIAAPAVSPASTATSRVNSAGLSYVNASLATLTAGPATSTISVEQPRLLLAKTRVAPATENVVEPGDTATFRLTVTNNGTAPAYNIALSDALPVGLRDATPVVLAATLNGADILGAFPAPTYATATGLWDATLSDTQVLLPGQTLVVDYQITVDATAPRGTTVTNSATIPSYASKASADATERRVYAPVGPSTQDLNIAARITGFVYHELSANAAKDPAEDWTSGTSVFVNLVPNTPISLPGFTAPANTVLRSVNVLAGAGAYTFNDVPAGDYRIVLTNTATATTVSAPAGWTLDTPADGDLTPLVVTNANLTDQNFGLHLPRALSGFVYNDITPNSVKDGFEDWVASVSVFVNLVRVNDNSVVRSATVAPGSGAYSFTGLPPAAYRVIVTNSAGSNTAVSPSGWIFRAPATGSLPVTLALVDLTDQNLGLFRGRTVRGVVFRDTGESGTANDGRRQGSEPGIGNVRVRLLSASLAVLDTALTDGAGNFALRIPAETVAGATLHVEEQNPPVHLSTGGRPGSAGGAYNRATDRITFTFADDDVTGLEFGDVPENAFISDGAQTVIPGATAYYRHQYIAGTAGTVTFSSANTPVPALPWTQVIVRDVNCDGQAGAAEPVIDGVALAVAAGEEICLVLKDNSPPGVSFGAVNTTVITATFTYPDASPALPADVRTRQDITTTGASSSAGLQLLKAVDKTLAKPGEILTYTITYTNAGAEELTTLFIDDRTPHYTVFATATAAVLPDGLTAVVITAPAVGEAGSIRWTFDGTLPPGGSGTVTFQVRVQE